MIGKRVYNTDCFKPGEYGRHPSNNVWYACSPNNHHANLRNHYVTEHEDGTITVSPSIKISLHEKELYHGFLEKGVWREC